MLETLIWFLLAFFITIILTSMIVFYFRYQKRKNEFEKLKKARIRIDRDEKDFHLEVERSLKDLTTALKDHRRSLEETKRKIEDNEEMDQDQKKERLESMDKKLRELKVQEMELANAKEKLSDIDR